MAESTREVQDPASRTRLGARLVALVTTLLVALTVLVIAAPAAVAGNTPESYAARMAQLINEARAAYGLRPVTVTSGTSRVALGWAQHLAAQQALSHNPRLAQQVEANGSPNWTVVSENVGSGYVEDPDAVFAAYLNSPGHRRNILDARMRFVGVAAVFTGNTAWDVMNFVDSYGTAAPAPAPAPAKPAPAKPAPVQAAPAVQQPRPAAAPVPQEVRPAAQPAAQQAAASAPRAAAKPAANAAAKRRLTAARPAAAAAQRPRVAEYSAVRPVAAPTAIFEQPLVAFSAPLPASAPLGTGSGTPFLAVAAAIAMLVLVSGGIAAARR